MKTFLLVFASLSLAATIHFSFTNPQNQFLVRTESAKQSVDQPAASCLFTSLDERGDGRGNGYQDENTAFLGRLYAKEYDFTDSHGVGNG